MALSLIAPTAAITHLANGIVVARCKDYVGSSAGASVVSDALSVSGDVVKEEQTIAVQTTFTSEFTLWESVDDSVNIPLADLGLEANTGYEVLVSCRTDGDPPSNAMAQATQFTYDKDGATVGFGFGDDDLGVWDIPNLVARKFLENYQIYDLGNWDDSVPGATEIIVRGWGVTGGDVSFYFDLVYFLPLYSLDDSGLEAAFSGARFPLDFLNNGVVNPDKDNDATSAPWLGKFSVLNWRMPWVEEIGGLLDMQEDDDESSSYETQQGEWDEGQTTYLAYHTGLAHIPAFTIVSDDMSETSNETAIGIFQWETPEGYIGTTTDDLYGWRLDGSGIANCFLPASVATESFWRIWYGGVERYQDSPSSTDPREYFPTLNVLSGIFTAKFSFDTLQESYASLGVRSSPILNAVDHVLTLGRLEMDSSGDVNLSIVWMDSAAGGWYYMASPVPVFTGTSTGDQMWLKVERRGYFWRARAWMDGDAEPSTWDADGYEPLVRQTTGQAHIDYPWDDNWNTAADDTVFYDPRQYFGSSNTRPSAPTILAGVSPGLAAMNITADDYSCVWDPGSGTPGDVTTKTLKYDDTVVLDSQVVVPYGSMRFVHGPANVRNFNSGANGFNIRSWKDSGLPNLDAAVVANIWQRLFVTPPVLYGSIKRP